MSKFRCHCSSPLPSGRTTWLAVAGLAAVLMMLGLWFVSPLHDGVGEMSQELAGQDDNATHTPTPKQQVDPPIPSQPVDDENLRDYAEVPVPSQPVEATAPDLEATPVLPQPDEVELAAPDDDSHAVVPVQSDSIEIQRYPTVEAPTQVVIAQEFAVQVSLTEELLTPEASASPKIFSLIKQDKWMLEVVLTGRGFDFRDGRNAGLIELPRDGDSTVALFHLTAREVGEPTRNVYASFYHESRFLFRVSRPISVATNTKQALIVPTARTADANASAAKLQLVSTAPDLSIEIISGRILIHARDFQPTNIAYTPPIGLAEFLRERYARLATVAGRGLSPVDRQSAKDTAKGIGREVYRRFAPPSFKKAFWSLVDTLGEDFRTIQIYSDQPLLPWELMVPARNDQERDHLGLEFEISRWHAREDAAFVASPPRYLDLEELVVVAPRYDPPLKSVEQEIQDIQSFPISNIRVVRGQEAKLKETFSRLPRGILHFAGHGVILQNDTQGTTYAILLEDDRKLTLDEWKGMFSRDRTRHPFVFFNACDIGRTQKVVNFVDGWAPAMLDTGASGYVGALWPVADAKAAMFARRFYGALEKGLARGDARVLSAIGEARKLYQETGDPTFLAYVYYGDNDLTMKLNF